MTDTYFTLIVVALGVVLGAALVCLIGLVGWYVIDTHTGRRRPRIDHGDRQDALEAWGEPIPMMWPSRAPRNGDPFGDEHPETPHEQH